ncbi:MAG: hypothetical protein IKM97_04025 [Clostridia bacterium]|nr:hypothetical protein [Clostridia bacterium]
MNKVDLVEACKLLGVDEEICKGKNEKQLNLLVQNMVRNLEQKLGLSTKKEIVPQYVRFLRAYEDTCEYGSNPHTPESLRRYKRS